MTDSNPKKGYKIVKFALSKYDRFAENMQIPNQWEVLSIHDVCNIVNGSAFPEEYQTGDSGEFPFLKVSDFNKKENHVYIEKWNNSISSKTKKILNAHLCPANSTIFPKIGEAMRTNKRRLLTQESCIDNNCMALIPKNIPKNIDPGFFFYFFSLIKLENFEQVTTLPYVNNQIIKEIKILRPPLPEQEKIFSILSNIDNLQRNIIQIIEQRQLLKKNIANKLFHTGIDHTEFQTVTLCNLINSKLVSIPEKWEVKPLKELAKINPKLINRNYVHENILYIDIGSIEDFKITKYDELKLVNSPSRAKRIVEKNDIIISTVRPYLNAFTIVNDSRKNLVCSTGFTVVRPKKPEDLNFIFSYLITNDFAHNIYRYMQGMSYPAVTHDDIANTPIPYPTDKSERIRISNVILSLDVQIQKEKLHKSNLERLKKGLMQKLLTGQIRVKV